MPSTATSQTLMWARTSREHFLAAPTAVITMCPSALQAGMLSCSMRMIRLLVLQVGGALQKLVENANFRHSSGRHLHSICLESRGAMLSNAMPRHASALTLHAPLIACLFQSIMHPGSYVERIWRPLFPDITGASGMGCVFCAGALRSTATRRWTSSRL
jgi:hypothetical protein